MTIVTGHQPVYLPWLGLFHKIALADVFVFMDDVQYLTGDWNNRNYVRGPQGPIRLTAPVRLNASSSMILRDIALAADPWPDRKHWQLGHWRTLKSCYARAPYWSDYAPFFDDLYTARPWQNLADLNECMLRFLLDALAIETTLVKASDVGFSGQKSDLILDHCRYFSAELCVLGAHGRDYIVQQDFIDHGVSLYYQDYQHPIYQQRFDGFKSHLSVVDLLFNHGPNSSEILLSGNVTKADLHARLAELAGNPEVLDLALEAQT